MSLEEQSSQSGLLDAIVNLSILVNRGGGTGTSLRHLKDPGVAKAGKGLELWAKHFLAQTIEFADTDKIKTKWGKTFSFTGGTNNPPDAMLTGSYAVEIKKTETKAKKVTTPSGNLALNSSFPVRTLRAADTHISAECLQAERWTEKPFLYIVGLIHEGSNSIRALWLIDGRCLSDHEVVYLNQFNTVKKAILDLKSTETKELGRFNSLDTRMRTNLRVRGMWEIEHPARSLKSIFQEIDDQLFTLNCLIPESDFLAAPEEARARLRAHASIGLTSKPVDIPDPTDKTKTMSARLISGSWSG